MPPPPDRPGQERPRRDFAAEELAERQVTNAYIQFRRGLIAEAEAATRGILSDRPADPGAWELLGDIHASRGELKEASESYQAALKLAPGRVAAETKFGRTTLALAERKRQEQIGVAYASSKTSLIRHGRGQEERRSGAWMAVGSALFPGLGQLLGGQTIKGAIIIGIYLIGLGCLALQSHGAKQFYVSTEFWVISAILTLDWVYAVADAAVTSSAKNSQSS